MNQKKHHINLPKFQKAGTVDEQTGQTILDWQGHGEPTGLHMYDMLGRSKDWDDRNVLAQWLGIGNARTSSSLSDYNLGKLGVHGGQARKEFINRRNTYVKEAKRKTAKYDDILRRWKEMGEKGKFLENHLGDPAYGEELKRYKEYKDKQVTKAANLKTNVKKHWEEKQTEKKKEWEDQGGIYAKSKYNENEATRDYINETQVTQQPSLTSGTSMIKHLNANLVNPVYEDSLGNKEKDLSSFFMQPGMEFDDIKGDYWDIEYDAEGNKEMEFDHTLGQASYQPLGDMFPQMRDTSGGQYGLRLKNPYSIDYNWAGKDTFNHPTWGDSRAKTIPSLTQYNEDGEGYKSPDWDNIDVYPTWKYDDDGVPISYNKYDDEHRDRTGENKGFWSDLWNYDIDARVKGEGRKPQNFLEEQKQNLSEFFMDDAGSSPTNWGPQYPWANKWQNFAHSYGMNQLGNAWNFIVDAPFNLGASTFQHLGETGTDLAMGAMNDSYVDQETGITHQGTDWNRIGNNAYNLFTGTWPNKKLEDELYAADANISQEGRNSGSTTVPIEVQSLRDQGKTTNWTNPNHGGASEKGNIDPMMHAMAMMPISGPFSHHALIGQLAKPLFGTYGTAKNLVGALRKSGVGPTQIMKDLTTYAKGLPLSKAQKATKYQSDMDKLVSDVVSTEGKIIKEWSKGVKPGKTLTEKAGQAWKPNPELQKEINHLNSLMQKQNLHGANNPGWTADTYGNWKGYKSIGDGVKQLLPVGKQYPTEYFNPFLKYPYHDVGKVLKYTPKATIPFYEGTSNLIKNINLGRQGALKTLQTEFPVGSPRWIAQQRLRPQGEEMFPNKPETVYEYMTKNFPSKGRRIDDWITGQGKFRNIFRPRTPLGVEPIPKAKTKLGRMGQKIMNRIKTPGGRPGQRFQEPTSSDYMDYYSYKNGGGTLPKAQWGYLKNVQKLKNAEALKYLETMLPALVTDFKNIAGPGVRDAVNWIDRNIAPGTLDYYNTLRSNMTEPTPGEYVPTKAQTDDDIFTLRETRRLGKDATLGNLGVAPASTEQEASERFLQAYESQPANVIDKTINAINKHQESGIVPYLDSRDIFTTVAGIPAAELGTRQNQAETFRDYMITAGLKTVPEAKVFKETIEANRLEEERLALSDPYGFEESYNEDIGVDDGFTISQNVGRGSEYNIEDIQMGLDFMSNPKNAEDPKALEVFKTATGADYVPGKDAEYYMNALREGQGTATASSFSIPSRTVNSSTELPDQGAAYLNLEGLETPTVQQYGQRPDEPWLAGLYDMGVQSDPRMIGGYQDITPQEGIYSTKRGIEGDPFNQSIIVNMDHTNPKYPVREMIEDAKTKIAGIPKGWAFHGAKGNNVSSDAHNLIHTMNMNTLSKGRATNPVYTGHYPVNPLGYTQPLETQMKLREIGANNKELNTFIKKHNEEHGTDWGLIPEPYVVKKEIDGVDVEVIMMGHTALTRTAVHKYGGTIPEYQTAGETTNWANYLNDLNEGNATMIDQGDFNALKMTDEEVTGFNQDFWNQSGSGNVGQYSQASGFNPAKDPKAQSFMAQYPTNDDSDSFIPQQIVNGKNVSLTNADPYKYRTNRPQDLTDEEMGMQRAEDAYRQSNPLNTWDTFSEKQKRKRRNQEGRQERRQERKDDPNRMSFGDKIGLGVKALGLWSGGYADRQAEKKRKKLFGADEVFEENQYADFGVRDINNNTFKPNERVAIDYQVEEGGEIIDVDEDILRELIAAGAGIEIL